MANSLTQRFPIKHTALLGFEPEQVFYFVTNSIGAAILSKESKSNYVCYIQIKVFGINQRNLYCESVSENTNIGRIRSSPLRFPAFLRGILLTFVDEFTVLQGFDPLLQNNISFCRNFTSSCGKIYRPVWISPFLRRNIPFWETWHLYR